MRSGGKHDGLETLRPVTVIGWFGETAGAGDSDSPVIQDWHLLKALVDAVGRENGSFWMKSILTPRQETCSHLRLCGLDDRTEV
jgi:hypothetical protein